ncbi:MAG: sulfatase-like hydrolase/transferase [Gammaproteobacteria bacterium]
MTFANYKKPANLLTIIISLTVIAITGQILFFLIHYKVSDLLDSLVQSSLKSDMFHAVIILPLIQFFLIQLISYIFFITWVWFISIAISDLFKLSRSSAFWLTLFLWTVSCSTVLSLNNFYYPDSFFANLIPTNTFILFISISVSVIATLLAYANCVMHKHYLKTAGVFLLLALIFNSFSIYDGIKSRAIKTEAAATSEPNIILIGVDSVRPDFVSYFGNHQINTPNIDSFLKNATVFTEAYTPLARTFTSWMSILTSLYPKHSNARSNLADPDLIHADETLSQRLQAAGYETIYATDEKRFSNITQRYGFDRLVGPGIGVNDFILGGLGDFPLTNLMVNSALGRVLFPYNYANRAAAITYEPDKFLQLVKLSLAKRSNKPLFLSIHLCISHWPFTWAHDQQPANATLAERYLSSVIAVDQQLGQLMQILKHNSLLDHSLVVLLSDHGTTVGLPNDRITTEKNYVGDRKKIKSLSVFKLGTASEFSQNFKKDFRIDTSYGQATDVLSLKQYHVLFAFKGFGIDTHPHEIKTRTSLLDIAPTILDFLNLEKMKTMDGISLKTYLLKNNYKNLTSRPLFIESGHTINEIQGNDIFVDKVIKNAIGVYQINPNTGFLFIKPAAEKSIIQSKQRAILLGDWLLARYPTTTRSKLVKKSGSPSQFTFQSYDSPSFYVIANLKTGKWSIGLDSQLAKQAPLKELTQKFNDFYGDEI